MPRLSRFVPLAAVLAIVALLPPAARGSGAAGALGELQAEPPALLVMISVDQMRADYLDRFGPQLTGGLRTLLENGAVFTNAHQAHAITATAPGHAAMLSGLYPRDNGIVDNSWFNLVLNRRERAAEDPDYSLVGLDVPDDGPGVSPLQFRGTSLIDWLRDRYPGSRSVSISRKDRAAVFMAPSAEHAYWFYWTGRFVTSDYYREEVPEWVASFNDADWMGRYAGKPWTLLKDESEYTASRRDDFPGEMAPRGFGRVFPHWLPRERRPLGTWILATPFMDEAILDLARVAVDKLELGTHAAPDVLTLGLSSTDSVGHAFGPFSREIQDQILRVDLMLADFFSFLDEAVGLDRVLIALTSDHGVVATPEYSREQGHKAERLRLDEILRGLEGFLAPRFGAGRWFRSYSYGWLLLDRELAAELDVDPEEVIEAAHRYLEALDPIAAVFSRRQLLTDRPPADELEARVRRSFFPDRSGDLYLVHPPLYLFHVGTAANHQSPYDYDSHVPMMLLGAGVRPGRYTQRVAIVDLAPTLAALLHVDAPANLEGAARAEIFVR